MTSQRVRAAIYLRISLDRKMDGLAIERQREDCEAIARARGWDVVETYVDQSKSATDKTKSRPSYDRMVNGYKNGEFSAIICWDLDRLTRQTRQLEDWIDAAQDRGLLLVTANGEADLTNDGGRMYARIKAAVARAEVERKSARQSRAQAQRAEQGRAPKGVRPLGYTVQGQIIAQEAEAVKAIYAAFNAGSSLRSITAALSGASGQDIPNVPTLPRHNRTLVSERNVQRAIEDLDLRPVPENGPWPSSTVLGVLRNPRYAGYSTYTPKEKQSDGHRRRSSRASILKNDEGSPVIGQWEPLIDGGTWWAVQDKLDNPARITNRSGTDRRHLGSGLFLCGVCGAPVQSHSARYRCAGHVMRSRQQIDAFVLAAVRARLAKADLTDLLPHRDEPRLHVLKVEIGQHRAKIARAQRDYDNEDIEGGDLKRVREREEASIAVLEVERMRLTVSTGAIPIFSSKDPVSAFNNSDLGAQRGVIDVLCHVRLQPHPRGVKTFNAETVQVDWK
jgi:site-specific DNA recombinase